MEDTKAEAVIVFFRITMDFRELNKRAIIDIPNLLNYWTSAWIEVIVTVTVTVKRYCGCLFLYSIDS